MPIYSYTAEDAMNDDILHDVSTMAREAGFIIPVRITVGIKQLVTPDEEAQKHGQSYEGRLWDVLCVAAAAVRASVDETLVSFKVTFQDRPGIRYTRKLWAALDMTSGPGIHIMLPEEY